MKIIVGLGNPGKEYNSTRHNVGFKVLDRILESGKLKSWKVKNNLNSEISEWIYNKDKVVLVRPLTYMNNSGIAVAKVLCYYKIDPKDMIVVHDDMDIEFGDIQIKNGGGTAGHHGLESIIDSLGGNNNFVRLRIGIGKKGCDVLSTTKGGRHVVGKFSKLEIKKLPEIIERVILAIECCFNNDLEICMTEYNKKISDNLPMERN